MTVVQNRSIKGGGYVSVACNVDDFLPLRPGYVRSKIRLSASFMLPFEGDPNRTEIIQVTQVSDLGGVADTAVARKIQDGIINDAPVEFMTKFGCAVMKGAVAA